MLNQQMVKNTLSYTSHHSPHTQTQYERDIPEIKTSHSDELFTVKLSKIRKRLSMVDRNKSVGADGIPCDILKMDGEAIIPYLLRLVDMP
jgi:hypothetical protein